MRSCLRKLRARKECAGGGGGGVCISQISRKKFIWGYLITKKLRIPALINNPYFFNFIYRDPIQLLFPPQWESRMAAIKFSHYKSIENWPIIKRDSRNHLIPLISPKKKNFFFNQKKFFQKYFFGRSHFRSLWLFAEKSATNIFFRKTGLCFIPVAVCINVNIIFSNNIWFFKVKLIFMFVIKEWCQKYAKWIWVQATICDNIILHNLFIELK